MPYSLTVAVAPPPARGAILKSSRNNLSWVQRRLGVGNGEPGGSFSASRASGGVNRGCCRPAREATERSWLSYSNGDASLNTAVNSAEAPSASRSQLNLQSSFVRVPQHVFPEAAAVDKCQPSGRLAVSAHSSRSATIGCTRVARCAGKNVANNATNATSETTTA
jgi:hypothetical protein